MYVQKGQKINSNGYQTAVKRGNPQTKFVDLAQTQNPSSAGNVLSGFNSINQGVAVSQRTGDTIFMKSLYVNYTVTQLNSDEISSTRVIFFQWIPSSLLGTPVAANILQTGAIDSFYNWQLSSNFRILDDRIFHLSGEAGVPTSASQCGYFGEISLARINTKVEFTPGLSTGSNQLYCLVISDSVIAPFPFFTIRSRITYSED
jgi:hypothetical protein